MTRRIFAGLAGLVGLATVAACAQVIGLDTLHDGTCTPGATQECPYSGPDGTLGVGNCKAGSQTCAGDGKSWSACAGEVLPVLDGGCAASAAETCSIQPATGCCVPGSMSPCYDGPMGTEGVGACKGGNLVCGADGVQGTTCMGEVKPQQETCANNDDLNCDGLDCIEWAVQLGDAAMKLAGSMAVDGSGNIYVSGAFAGSIPVGNTTLVAPGTYSAFFVKLDPTGKPVLGQSMGTGGSTDIQSFDAIAVDAQGNIFVGGRTTTNAMFQGQTVTTGLFVMRLKPDGTLVWVKDLTTEVFCSTGDSNLLSLATTATGDVVAGGYFCGTINFGGSPMKANAPSAFIAKLSGADGSGTGSGYWGKVFGDPGGKTQQIQKAAVDGSGNIIAAGQFEGTLNVGLGPISSIGGFDAFLAKFDATGAPIWYDHLGGPGDEKIGAMFLDPNGGPVVSGTFDQSIGIGGTTTQATETDAGISTNAFVAHFDAGDGVVGKYFIANGLGGATVDAQGELIFFGMFGGTLDLGGTPLMTTGGTYAPFLAKVGSNGNVAWQRTFANPGGLILGAAMGASSVGEPIIAADFAQTVNLGSGTFNAPQNFGVLVAKFGL